MIVWFTMNDIYKCYFQPEVSRCSKHDLKSILFVCFHIPMNAMCKSRCTACTCKSRCTALKKLVVGISYPMPLRYSVKAALSYIAAGSCDSVVYI